MYFNILFAHLYLKFILVKAEFYFAKSPIFIKAQNQNSGTTGHFEWFSSMPFGSSMCPFQNRKFNTSGIVQGIFKSGQGVKIRKIQPTLNNNGR